MPISLNYRKILILAAGKGTRLMPLTEDRPKCLVEVGGKPILFWQLRALSLCGIQKIIMVIGYRGKMIEEYIANNFPRLEVKFIHNPRYQTTEKLHSWLLAKNAVIGGHISLDSDIIFHPNIIRAALLPPKEISAALFCGKERAKDETRVSIASDGTIVDIGKDLKPEKAAGKFTGIYVFSENFSKLFFPAAEELLNSNVPHAFGFDALRKIRKERDAALMGVDVSGYPFVEIDEPEDLKTAEKKILPRIVNSF